MIPYETSAAAQSSWGRFVDPASMLDVQDTQDGPEFKLYKDLRGWDPIALNGGCRSNPETLGSDAFPAVTKECTASDVSFNEGSSFGQGARYTGRLLGAGWCDRACACRRS